VRDAYSLIDEAQDPQSGTTITDAMIVAAPNKETREILEKIQDNQQKTYRDRTKRIWLNQNDIACYW
jgi:predicted transcriptional regulator